MSSQPSTSETLQPGQSMTETSSWNGVANEGTLAGANVWGSFNVAASGATTAISQAFEIANPLTVSVTTNQSTYQPGQSVQITATETNSSNQAITILNTQNAFTVVSGSNGSYPVTDVSSSVPSVTLQPGQSETLTATWDPSAAQGGTGSTTGTNASESYSVDFKNYMGVTSSSPFVIEAPPTAPTSPPTAPTSPPTAPASPPTTPTSPPSAPSSPPLEPIAPVVSPNSPSGASSSTPTSAASNPSPITVILTTNQSGSRSGHPVHLTVKLKNVTKTSQRLAANARTEGQSLTYSLLYDDTLDVRTFAARRMEGSVAFSKKFTKSVSGTFEAAYKADGVSDIVVPVLLVSQFLQTVRLGTLSANLLPGPAR